MPIHFLFFFFKPGTEIKFTRMTTGKSALQRPQLSMILVFFFSFPRFLHFLSSPRFFKYNRRVKKIKNPQHIVTAPPGLQGCFQMMLMDVGTRRVVDDMVTSYSPFTITQAKMQSHQAVPVGKGTAGEQRCRSQAFPISLQQVYLIHTCRVLSLQ